MRRHRLRSGIGSWSIRHPWLAIVLWLAFVACAAGSLAATGSKQLDSGTTGESARAEALLRAHRVWPDQREYAYVHSGTLVAGDPTFHAVLSDVANRMRGATGGNTTIQLSHDRRSALVSSGITQQFSADDLRASVLAASASYAGVTTALDDTSGPSNNDLQRAELLSVPVTLLVLLLAFGALAAAAVPVLLAVTAVLAAFGLLGPISQAFPLDDSVKTVVLLIGMAVGVDYALFYVVRSREERSRGLTPKQALERTARTSGRTVVVAGSTVILAMASQYAIGSDVFNGIASGTIAVVACAVAGSVTVLPAVLVLVGTHIDRGRIPFLPHLRTDTTESRFWPALIACVMRRPVISVLGSVALLTALALPAVGMHLAYPSSDALASSSRAALATNLSTDFPSTAAPAIVAVVAPLGRQAAVRRALARLEVLASRRGIAHTPFTLTTSPDKHAASLALPLTGLGDNAASRRAVATLRDELIPATLGRIPGVQTAVTGDTARDVDFTHQMRHGLPYVIGFVLVLAFLLLLVTFRSIVVPIKAIVLNLLSVAASYGVLVLVFQHHWAEGLLGFKTNGAIISWLPLFLFVILFGLSMDYHIFILSRVREGIDSGLDNDDALRQGITRTAGVVTSAALVMFAVFSLFATSTALDLKQAGVGLAIAVILDATVVRGILLAASMTLLGDANWYLPHWLAWIPDMSGKDVARADRMSESGATRD